MSASAPSGMPSTTAARRPVKGSTPSTRRWLKRAAGLPIRMTTRVSASVGPLSTPHTTLTPGELKIESAPWMISP